MNVLEKILEEIGEATFHEDAFIYAGDVYVRESVVNEIIRSHIDHNGDDTEMVGWIPVSERLPEEHDSVFKKFKGTDEWRAGMFEKESDDVNATIEFEDGTRKTTLSYTFDGEWNLENRPVKMKVIAWQPLPDPYKEINPEDIPTPAPPVAGTADQITTVIIASGSQDKIYGNRRRKTMDDIFKNAEGYADRVAGKAIKAADKQPEHVSFIVSACKGIARKFNCEIEGRIKIRDKETGRSWG